jgi:radical SAM-linked protein
MMTSQTPITRIRVRYAKGESLRFTGHLDLQRLWERTLRRSRLPIRYSQGYHPRARINLASALPLGFVSDDELLDFWMDEPRPLDEVLARLSTSSPPGLQIKAVQSVDLSEDALQVRMKASEFMITFYDTQSQPDLQSKIANLLEQDHIPRSRRKKTYDLRPLILNLEVIIHPSGEPGLWMRLLAEPGSTGRPDDVLDQLGYPNTAYLVKRTRLILT